MKPIHQSLLILAFFTSFLFLAEQSKVNAHSLYLNTYEETSSSSKGTVLPGLNDLVFSATPSPSPELDPIVSGTVTPSPTTLPSISILGLFTATITSTSTSTFTPTFTPTLILSPTATNTPTATPTPTQIPNIYLPNVGNQIFVPTPTPTPLPWPIQQVFYCASPYQPIPDDSAKGVSNSIEITDPRFLHDANILLDIGHPWIGDLSVRLTHENTGRTALLVDRPMLPGMIGGCQYDNIGAILDDEISSPVEKQCASTGYYAPAAVSGIYTPNEPLSIFNGDPIEGTWTINVSDHGIGGVGTLKNWCLVATIGDFVTPIPTPTPISVPSSAMIHNISGHPQQLPLDCESRVAVDWAGYFGVKIGELAFFDNLPVSDNPDQGFVGNVYGVWGQIPPYPYGVHAEPVAALLRSYGLSAYAHRPLSWDDLRAEVAAKHPVFVWVIGAADMLEIPIYYTSGDSHTSIVAHFEHVVMVIGYAETSVTILDGGVVKTRSIAQFLSSWSALDNMAITTQP